jgi:hypothetical protein
MDSFVSCSVPAAEALGAAQSRLHSLGSQRQGALEARSVQTCPLCAARAQARRPRRCGCRARSPRRALSLFSFCAQAARGAGWAAGRAPVPPTGSSSTQTSFDVDLVPFSRAPKVGVNRHWTVSQEGGGLGGPGWLRQARWCCCWLRWAARGAPLGRRQGRAERCAPSSSPSRPRAAPRAAAGRVATARPRGSPAATRERESMRGSAHKRGSHRFVAGITPHTPRRRTTASSIHPY